METALYLIPVTLGENWVERVLPPFNKEVILSIKHFIVENERSARRFLKLVDKDIDIAELTFYELNEHTDVKTIGNYLDPILKQKLPMGVISEAGCPAIADPGADVVAMAQKKNVKVVPLVGPSSILLTVMGSGFNGQSFAFNGYLPVKETERANKLRSLEKRAWNENQTQLFIETPYRNAAMIETALKVLKKETKFCIASGITTQTEFIKTKTVEQWKKEGAPVLGKVPTVFAIFK